MKLSECITYINKALNYPAISLNDIDLYFDMAFAELNTTLHISIPSLKKQQELFVQNMSKNDILTITITELELNNSIPDAPSTMYNYYYDRSTDKFHVTINGITIETDAIKGVLISEGVPTYYITAKFGSNAWWVNLTETNAECYEISEWLPEDWIMLWLIPYVCFKYTVRDGGTAATFAEELTQGFQQLQDSYNIPSRINLATVAADMAYTDIVKEYLDAGKSLNTFVPLRAIKENMKHSRNELPEYGSMYDRGGF